MDALQANFIRQGWDSAAGFAWVPCDQPGQGAPDEELNVFRRNVVEPLTGDRDSTHVTALRRLHFEVLAMNVADIRRRMDATDDAAPIMLPVVEKEARRAELARSLVGVSSMMIMIPPTA